ncbi:MAG TPA: hypothetical protein VN767_03340 [Streptosporangiaceae bacterium]|nr:hypothetical protein [Streptosporangiaceae bacterium]
MKRVVIAIVAAGIVAGAASCGTNGTTSPPSGARSRPVKVSWAIVSCQVYVEYLDNATTVDHYVPDTGVNFRQHYAGNNASASLAAVVTLVNHSDGPAPLPTGLVVSFTDHTGRHVGSPQTFNNADGTGYGGAVAHGRGSGEKFSATTLFNPGQAVAESPDLGAVPPKPDLNCQASKQ